MALPSQTERTGSGGRVSASRGRGVSSKIVTGVVVVLIAAGAVVGILYYKSQPAAGPSPSVAQGPSTEKSPAPGGNSARMPPVGSKPPVKEAAPPSGAQPPSATGSTNPAATPPTTAGRTDGPAATPAPSTPPSPAPTGTESATGKPPPVSVVNTDAAAPASTGTSTDSRPPAPGTQLPPSASTQDVRALMAQGDDAARKGDAVLARQLYSRALVDPSAAKADQETIRQKAAALNEDLIFSPKVTAGDPLTETYTIQPGDAVARLPRKRDLAVDWRLIKRVNQLDDEDLTRLKVGQKLKLVRGPFHAIVTKSDYRLDLFAGSPDEPENWVYIRSFKVGLGEGNGTPVGDFMVKNRQSNPPWTNPRTGEKFAADDPQNPIGEYWVGWEGIGPAAGYKGFGIHGTIDPSSIGQQKSMGCVRLGNEDVGIVFEMLTEQISMVRVRP